MGKSTDEGYTVVLNAISQHFKNKPEFHAKNHSDARKGLRVTGINIRNLRGILGKLHHEGKITYLVATSGSITIFPGK